MRAYHLTGHEHPRLIAVERPDPVAGPGEVVVDLAAVSLNYRDLILARTTAGLIPLSDGAGMLSQVGAGVVERRVGERVVIAFMPGWLDGAFTAAKQATSLGGGGIDGVLAERIAVPAAAVVAIPDDLDMAAAACLPCAGVTAWAALFERRPLVAGETLLLLGTGGVSILALQLAKRAGARVIITSSSDDKLARAQRLGADELINYVQTPEWAAEVVRRTGGLGADLAVDVGGPGTLNHSLQAVRADGRIALMGVLTGFAGPIDTAAILHKRITLQGIYVGPVTMLQAVVDAGLRPVIDREFNWADSEAAYDALAAAQHVGKIVIRMDSRS